MRSGRLAATLKLMAAHHERETPTPGAPIGVTVGSLMSTPPVVVPAESTSADARHQLECQPHDAYPVVGHDGRALGLLTTDQLGHAIHDCYCTLVNEITDRDPKLLVDPWLDAGLLLGSASFRRARHAVVVNREGRPVGIVSDRDVRQAIRSAGRGAQSRTPEPVR